MNPANTIAQPAASSPLDNVLPKIFIRLSLPECPGLTPSGNQMGALLLARLIEARLDAAGIFCELPSGFAGDLNQGIGLFTVEVPARAMRVIVETFESVGLLNCVEIGQIDPERPVIALVHPAKSEIPFPFDQIEVQSARYQALNSLVTALTQPPAEKNAHSSEGGNPS